MLFRSRLIKERDALSDKQREAIPPWVTMQNMMGAEGIVPSGISNAEDALIESTGNRGAGEGVLYSIEEARNQPFLGRAQEKIVDFAREKGFDKKIDSTLTYLADADLPIARVQQKLAEQPEARDYLLHKRLTGSKVSDATRKFDERELKPFIEFIAKKGIRLEDVHELAWAQHAPERNLRMKRINARRFIDKIVDLLPESQGKKITSQLEDIDDNDALSADQKRDLYIDLMDNIDSIADLTKGKYTDIIEIQTTSWARDKDRWSGMTNEKAEQIIDKWKGDRRWDAAKEATNRIREMAAKTLLVNKEAGEISKDEYQAIKNSYQFYVPLHRDGFDSGMPAVGSSSTGPIGRPIKYAAGSTKMVDNIVGHIVAARESAISRKFRLDAGRALYEMVKANPSEDWWIDKVKMVGKPDVEGNIRYVPDRTIEDNEVQVKIDGEVHVIGVNDKDPTMKAFIDAINRKPVGLGPIMQVVQRFTRILASLNTSFAPEFILTNFARDIQTASINMEDSEGKRMQKKVLKGISPAMKTIWEIETGKGDGGPLKDVYERFQAAGGQIGWMQGYESIEDLGKQLEKEWDIAAGNRPVKATIQKTMKFIEGTNAAVENAVRFSLFKELIESGVSDAKAARAAKNLTVDFTRHGTAGPVINTLYMFANAGIQGNIRMIKGMARSKTIRKITGGIFAFGALASVLGSMAGEDDDGEEWYAKLRRTRPDLFTRNIIWMIPGTDGKYIKIPMAYGFGLFYVAGHEMASTLLGKQSAGSGAAQIGKALFDTFSPLGASTMMQTLTPTVLDPIAALSENRLWHGGSLMPKENPFGLPEPDSMRYFGGVNPLAKDVAGWLNDATGGSPWRSGWIDVSPETIEMLVETYSGSLGKFMKDTLAFPIGMLQGETSVRSTPFVRKYFGSYDKTSDKITYYDRVEEVKVFEKEFDAADTKEKAWMKKDPLFKVIPAAKATEKKIRDLRKKIKSAQQAGADTDRLEDKLEQLVESFNLQFNTTMAREAARTRG